jgi:bacteriocin biosynthesis cyclodehydratase domain-containing protein
MAGRSRLREVSCMQEPVHLVSVGGFGSAVARHLAPLGAPFAQVTADRAISLTPETWPGSRANVLVASRPALNIARLLESVSYERNQPFVPVVMDGTALLLGPVVIPGAGSCWTCWMRRLRQHSDTVAERVTLWQHYSDHIECGPSGYLEPFAAMIATRISQIMDSLDNRSARGGQIWHMDMMSLKFGTSVVVGVHDCPRCGLHRPVQTRTYDEMSRCLAQLWKREDRAGRTSS